MSYQTSREIDVFTPDISKSKTILHLQSELRGLKYDESTGLFLLSYTHMSAGINSNYVEYFKIC